MKPEEIHLSDLYRIFIGEVPGFFYIELIFRSLFIYLLLIGSMRLMGKRMASQISRNEMAAVVALAAAVGIPLMNPDRGLLLGLIIAITIVVMYRLVAILSSRNERFEAITQDRISVLVNDGVLDLANMKTTRITRERLFAQLRAQEKTNLGKVKRLYLEANGLFSLVESPEDRPGLSVLPQTDLEFIGRMTRATDKSACHYCGYLVNGLPLSQKNKCPNCSHNEWADAIL